MRILLISDIHANLPALEAVVKEAKKIGYDQIWCAGDIVGYYPWPNEVVNWVKENVHYCVMGNHDAVVAGLIEPTYFSSYAYDAIVWTLQNLTEENKRFIASLPLIEKIGDTVLVHDTPDRPMSMYYIVDPQEALYVFQKTDFWLTVYGHTHMPILYTYTGYGVRVNYTLDGVVLERKYRHLLNPGSVGQPRDYVPLASFVVWDTDKNLLIHKRVDFDKEKVLKELKAKGLPLELGYRLFEGR
jgi:predicted phosphodiesterase